jgi:glycerol kinase
VLALDQGTTSSRAVVVDEHGAIRASAQRELPQRFVRPGWVEHDPDEIWRTQLETARAAVHDAGGASQIAAVGIANQRETTIVWERANGRPIYDAIVWQDRRTAALCDDLRANADVAALVRRKTGLVLDPYFSATKIRWILDNVEGARAKAARGDLAFGTVDSWLVFNLTGGARHVTDFSNASRTLLFDIETLDWDDELLHLFDVPRAMLPEALPSVGRFGVTSPEALGGEIPVTGVAGDQQAALVGQAGVREGLAKNTYGTGSFVVLNTGARIVRSSAGLLATIAYATGRDRVTYALEGSIFVTGAAVQWLRDGLGLIADSNEIEALARSVESSGGVYFVPAFAGLGAPYWDAHARGAILGLTRGTTKAHVARAVLEATAFQTDDVVRAMERDAGFVLSEMRVDGGAARNDLLMQIQADVLGRDVVRPLVTETTAFGAAYLAGIGAGYWRDLDDVARNWHEERRFHPALAAEERERMRAGWQRAVERSRRWDAAP